MPPPPTRAALHLHGHRDSINRRQWGNRRVVRATTSIDADCCDATGSQVKKSQRGNRVMRAVAGILSRARSGGKDRAKSAALTEPASPASVQLSRTNSAGSAASTHEDGQSSPDESEETTPSRPRVSFDAEVTTVIIEQMNDEEVRKTFYCRTEYAAFKDAYRTHRDTSMDWCRSNDVLPCNCDACQDDLVEGETHPAPSPEDNYDSAFEGPQRSSSGNSELALSGDEGDVSTVNNDKQAQADIPSPVGAVFQDGSDEDSSDDASEGARKKAIPNRPGHSRRSTWGGSSDPVPAYGNGSSHRRGSSLDDDWGVKSSVQEAVKCHGTAYAYQTLRLQGFSDLYVRTHFLPEVGPNGR